jgi:hypothetical protein
MFRLLLGERRRNPGGPSAEREVGLSYELTPATQAPCCFLRR